jgi:hypothetical protein
MNRCVVVTGIVWAMAATCVVGCGTAAVVDPEAKDVLRAMSDRLSGAQEFTFTGQEITEGLTPGAGHGRVVRNRMVAVSRPDRLRFDVTGPDIDLKLYYDGRALTAVGPDGYAVMPLPGNIDTVLDFVETEYEIKLVFPQLIRANPYRALRKWADKITYGGIRDLGGRQVHHIVLSASDAEGDLWIDAEGDPLPARAAVSNTVPLGSPLNTIIFADWDLAPELPDDLFAYEPPAEVAEIDLTDMLVRR